MKSKYQDDQKLNFGNDFSLFAVEDLTVAIELTAEDSGKFYTIGATGKTNVIIGTAANTGDSVRLVCDGTNWYTQGVTALDGSITVS